MLFLAVGVLALAPAAHGVSDQAVSRHELLGRSAEGRPIRVTELGDPDESRKVLVVGCIHGNEPAGIAIARALAGSAPQTNVDLWIVQDLNPDGASAGTRVNGRGVDLNRNFPFGWRRLGHRGTLHYSGPRPLSERESQLAAVFATRTLAEWVELLDAEDVCVGPVATLAEAAEDLAP